MAMIYWHQLLNIHLAHQAESDDDGAGLFDVANAEDDLDAELAAVLDNAASLVGRKRQRTSSKPAIPAGTARHSSSFSSRNA